MIFWKTIVAFAAPTLSQRLRRWIFQLGGLGFIPLGLLDGSPIPVPGSMDVLVIILSARRTDLWLYYAVMATVGSVIGAWVTYRWARQGGKGALERRLNPQRLKEIEERFARSGTSAVLLPALLPPPAPLTPFLLVAGALQYPVKKFVLMFGAGRIIRYTLLAFLAAHYGRKILRLFSEARHPVILVTVAILGVGLVVLLMFFSMKLHGRAQPN